MSTTAAPTWPPLAELALTPTPGLRPDERPLRARQQRRRR